MKKKIVLFFHLAMLLVFAIAASPLPSSAGNAHAGNYPSQLDYVDAQVGILLPRLIKFQNEYFSQHYQYFQGIDSAVKLVNANCGTSNVDLTKHPTDQQVTLESLWDYTGLPDAIPFSVRVDNYSGPEGPGYVLVIMADIDGVVWERDINIGPERYREAGWFALQ